MVMSTRRQLERHPVLLGLLVVGFAVVGVVVFAVHASCHDILSVLLYLDIMSLLVSLLAGIAIRLLAVRTAAACPLPRGRLRSTRAALRSTPMHLELERLLI